jgi:glycine dehydrogenase
VVEDSESRISELLQQAETSHSINFRRVSPTQIGISLDETVSMNDIIRVAKCFGITKEDFSSVSSNSTKHIQVEDSSLPSEIRRTSQFLTHPVFNEHHSETEMLRYIYHLQSKDLSLAHSMIPLGSCTMKLNATTEMLPISNPGFGNVHPFVPVSQTKDGYGVLIQNLSKHLVSITGMDSVSLQPNSGAQGRSSVIPKPAIWTSKISRRNVRSTRTSLQPLWSHIPAPLECLNLKSRKYVR